MRIFFLVLYYLLATRWPRQIGGTVIRRLCGVALLDKMANGSKINENVHLGKGVGLSLGHNSYLGRNCFLALDSKITIGDNVMVGPQVMIFTANHGLQPDYPMIEQPIKRAPVEIQNDVWVGARAIILPGVSLGHGSVVGAGAVVTKSVEPYAIVAGVPAKQVNSRKRLRDVSRK